MNSDSFRRLLTLLKQTPARQNRRLLVDLARQVLDLAPHLAHTDQVELVHAWFEASIHGRRKEEASVDSVWHRPVDEVVERMRELIDHLYLDAGVQDPHLEQLNHVGLALNTFMGNHHLTDRFLRDRWRRDGMETGAKSHCRLFSYLAWSGRGRLVTDRDLDEGYARLGKPQDAAAHRLADAVEAGRLEDAYAILNRLPQEARSGTIILFYSAMLAILDAHRLGRTTDAGAVGAAMAALRSQGHHDLAHDVRLRLGIACGDRTLIAEAARAEDRLASSWQIIASLPIEAMACLARWDDLARALNQREKQGFHLPIDDLMRAIHCHGTGDQDGMGMALAAAEAGARTHDATGRLELMLGMTRTIGHFDALAAGRRLPIRMPGGRPGLPALDGVLVGDSPAMAEIHALIRRFSIIDLPVLIVGPSGTGKELVARQLHERSARAGQPFVALNCAAVSPGLLEAELFGHVRGAFTGADRAGPGLIREAGDGTLFLDEIGDASPAFQAALLRLLDHAEYRPVGATQTARAGCRFLCATNVDLDRAVAEGRFRADLLYRLRRLEIRLLPLRDRPADVVPITRHLLADIAPGRRLAADAGEWLRHQHWPGNVRELRGLLERAHALHPTGPLGADMLTRVASTHPHLEGPAQAAPAVRAGRRPLAAAGPAEAPFQTDPGADMPVLERRLARAASVIRARGVVTRKELCRVLEIGPVTASSYLSTLIRRGMVERITPTGSTATHRFGWRQGR